MSKIFNKYNLFLMLIVFAHFFLIIRVEASTIVEGKINYNSVYIRTAPNLESSSITKQNFGFPVSILDYEPYKHNSKDYWYNIEFYLSDVKYNGYIRSDLVDVVIPFNKVAQTEYEKELEAKGFPYTYWPSIIKLHEKYPNWNFVAVNTNIEWKTAVNEQNYFGKNLFQGTEGYRSTVYGSYDWINNKWIAIQGTNWYVPNEDTLAYYIDPRNFLNERNIFMFENLNFHNSQTKELVTEILKGTFMEGSYTVGSNVYSYVDTLMEAGNTYNVSPIHLASRIVQEVGSKGSITTSGEPFICNGQYYSGGYYNFFNIGANQYACDGLMYASQSSGYGRPWNNIYKAIMGGAEFLAGGYINKGQNTSYFQKWNTSPTSSYTLYSHQYMQNIAAPSSESNKVYNAYNTLNIINGSFTFVIPIYNNMPERTVLPPIGNPNNLLNDLIINGLRLSDFDSFKSNYTYYVSDLTNSINIVGSPLVSTSTVSGTGNKQLEGEKTSITIEVKAGNGSIRNYVINVIKSKVIPITINDVMYKIGLKYNDGYVTQLKDNSTGSSVVSQIKSINNEIGIKIMSVTNKEKDGSIATGDKLVIDNNGQTSEYTFVLYGDSNGDAKINIVDLLRVQKNILGQEQITGVYQKATDVTKDGQINLKDLLKLQQHILGYVKIEQ